MGKIILKARKGIGGVAEGEAVVCKEPVNFMSDVNVWENPKDAKFTNKIAVPSAYHKSVAGKVLIFPTGKGGIFSSDIIMDLQAVGSAPAAFVIALPHPVWPVTSYLTGIPLVGWLDWHQLQAIETGDWVKVDAKNKIIEVVKKT